MSLKIEKYIEDGVVKYKYVSNTDKKRYMIVSEYINGIKKNKIVSVNEPDPPSFSHSINSNVLHLFNKLSIQHKSYKKLKSASKDLIKKDLKDLIIIENDDEPFSIDEHHFTFTKDTTDLNNEIIYESDNSIDYIEKEVENNYVLIENINEPINENVEQIIEPINENVEQIIEPKNENVEQINENVEPINENVESINENVEPIIEPINENVEPIIESINENVEPINENVEPINENVEPINENVEQIIEPTNEEKLINTLREIQKGINCQKIENNSNEMIKNYNDEMDESVSISKIYHLPNTNEIYKISYKNINNIYKLPYLNNLLYLLSKNNSILINKQIFVKDLIEEGISLYNEAIIDNLSIKLIVNDCLNNIQINVLLCSLELNSDKLKLLKKINIGNLKNNQGKIVNENINCLANVGFIYTFLEIKSDEKINCKKIFYEENLILNQKKCNNKKIYNITNLESLVDCTFSN